MLRATIHSLQFLRCQFNHGRRFTKIDGAQTTLAKDAHPMRRSNLENVGIADSRPLRRQSPIKIEDRGNHRHPKNEGRRHQHKTACL